MATQITDLHVDILGRIIFAVAKAPDGARDVARSMPTCKLFLEASNSIVVRRAVCFDYAQILSRTNLFRNTTGLLYKCAKAHNPSAGFQFAQVILTTSSQLVGLKMRKEKLNIFRDYRHRGRGMALEVGVLALFITRLTPAPGTDPVPSQEFNPRPMLYHWEFVKVFILNCTPMDIIYMSSHLDNYIKLFTAWQFDSVDVQTFLRLMDWLVKFGMADSDTKLVQVDLDVFFPVNGQGSVPRQSRGVRRMQIRDLFEEVRVNALHVFEVIIPKLR